MREISGWTQGRYSAAEHREGKFGEARGHKGDSPHDQQQRKPAPNATGCTDPVEDHRQGPATLR